MTNEPLISVVVPVYNVSAYLDRCVESLVSQTYQNLQILLVDDGSTDDSGKKCDEWATKDTRIEVVHKENGGLSDTRNCGIDNATGEYITFVDSDDYISEKMIVCLYELLKENAAELSICEPEHIFKKSQCNFSKATKQLVFSKEQAITEMWYQSSFLPMACGKLYKKDLFDDVRFTVGRRFEDIDIMHELFWRCERIAYSDARLYGYVHRENSITTGAFSEKDLDILKVADRILAFSADKSESIQKAAKSYAVVAALRIYLNAPKTEGFSEG